MFKLEENCQKSDHLQADCSDVADCNHYDCKKPCYYLEKEDDCDVKPELTMEMKTISENYLNLNTSLTVTASVESPIFRHVDLSHMPDSDYFNVFISSDTNLCGTVSIHPMKCPIPDGHDENDQKGVLSNWQHIYSTGALILNTNAYKEKSGFFIKFVAHATNCTCDQSCGRGKTAKVNVSKSFKYEVTDSTRRLNHSYSKTIYVESPVFYFVKLNNVTGFLQVIVTSVDTNCGTVSIHPLGCETKNCFQNIVHWQTMSKLGVLNINAEDYATGDGFFIKLTAHKCNNSIYQLHDIIVVLFTFTDSSECTSNKSEMTDFSVMKNFTFEIKKIEGESDIPIYITIVVLVLTLFCCIVFIMMRWHFHKILMPEEDKAKDQKEDKNPECPKNNGNGRFPHKILELWEKTGKHIKTSAFDSHQKYPKYLHELWQKTEMQNKKVTSGIVHAQNQMYSWLVLIMATCYSIPAIQMVIKQQRTVTGILASILKYPLCHFLPHIVF